MPMVAVKSMAHFPRVISRAVDVAEVSRSRFLPDVRVMGIYISTETLDTDRGATNVSAIEITLGK